jgi:RimJ/RimL family protein N-acetyltransferase
MNTLSVRELEEKDIPLIADYWVNYDPDHMIAMGVDLDKLPSREGITGMLTKQLKSPPEQKMTYALIWLISNKPVGHCNVNNISFGKEAFMHLHLWKSTHRQKGMGTELVKHSLPYFFKTLELQTLYCEPYALNPAPNNTLEKVGFEFEKQYITIPGSSNFEQEVKRWRMSRERYDEIYKV